MLGRHGGQANELLRPPGALHVPSRRNSPLTPRTCPTVLTAGLLATSYASPSDAPTSAPTLPDAALPAAGAVTVPALPADAGAAAVQTKSWWDDLKQTVSDAWNYWTEGANDAANDAAAVANAAYDEVTSRVPSSVSSAAQQIDNAVEDTVQSAAAIVRDTAADVAGSSSAGSAARPALALALAGAGAALLLACH